MALGKSIVLFKEPKHNWLLSRLEFVVQANGITHGPLAMDKPLSITGLMPGEYTLCIKASEFGRYNTKFKVARDAITSIYFAERLNLWSRFRIYHSKKPLVIELIRETPEAPLPKVKTLTSQFWVGWCDDPDEITDFFSEEPYYARFNELEAKLANGEIDETIYAKREEELDNCPITDFAKSQGERFLDHDFIEWRWEPDCKPLVEMFSGSSWVEMWAEKVEDRAKSLGVGKINCFVMIGLEEGVNPPQQVEKPCDIKLKSGTLVFIGEITHCDYPLS